MRKTKCTIYCLSRQGSRPPVIARDRRQLLCIRVIKVLKAKVKNSYLSGGDRDAEGGEGTQVCSSSNRSGL